VAANERPHLVKAIVNVEGFVAAFDRGAAWGRRPAGAHPETGAAIIRCD
jgi:hypothetical protein